MIHYNHLSSDYKSVLKYFWIWCLVLKTIDWYLFFIICFWYRLEGRWVTLIIVHCSLSFEASNWRNKNKTIIFFRRIADQIKGFRFIIVFNETTFSRLSNSLENFKRKEWNWNRCGCKWNVMGRFGLATTSTEFNMPKFSVDSRRRDITKAHQTNIDR